MRSRLTKIQGLKYLMLFHPFLRAHRGNSSLYLIKRIAKWLTKIKKTRVRTTKRKKSRSCGT